MKIEDIAIGFCIIAGFSILGFVLGKLLGAVK